MAKLCILLFAATLALANALFECPLEGTELFPMENCAMFYQCVNGEGREMMCPDGMHFNKHSHTCDYVIHAACDPKYKLCPERGHEFLPYPDDCTRFIECDEGHPNIIHCPAGLHYNPNKLTCDYPQNVKCRSIIV